MPKKVTGLTDKEIKEAKSSGKERTLSDGDGLQLRIRANGTKSWQFKYTNPRTKKLEKLSLGTYPSLSLKQARLKRAEYRTLLASKTSPKQYERQLSLEIQKAQLNSFKAVAKLWRKYKEGTVSKQHLEREWRALELYILPSIGELAIAEIKRQEVIDYLRPLETDGKYSTIKRLCQSLNQIMEYALNSGLIEYNCLTTVSKVFKKNKVEHMPSIRPEELGEFLNKLHSSETIQKKTKTLILWQLHTMTRPKEAARARWSDIDLEEKVWTIPASEMKRNREHKVPLTDSAIALLNSQKVTSYEQEFVFPGERDKSSHISTYTANAAIKRSLNYKGKLVAHGLRAIASTALHEHGFESMLIEACLSHVDKNETRASYMRSDFLEQRRPIMEWWSKYIEQAGMAHQSK
ncbi:MAG: tyrosine-type recombinase/integrase [Pseudomonadota bacterium]|nr:tyrosine-type recombinase/integrase [Pseudomonadota bacterium]